jgi:hypothetical protein
MTPKQESQLIKILVEVLSETKKQNAQLAELRNEVRSLRGEA